MKKYLSLTLLLLAMSILANCSLDQSVATTVPQHVTELPMDTLPTSTPYPTGTITETINPSPTPLPTATRTSSVTPTYRNTASPTPLPYTFLQEGTYLVYSAAYFVNNDPFGESFSRLEILSLDGEYQGYLMERSSEQGSISPDGKYLAYLEVLDILNPEQVELHIYDLENNEFIQIPNLTGACFDVNWAPNGNQLLISCETETGIDIYLFSIEEGLGPRLTDCGERDALECVYPAWSSDGKWIAHYKDSVRSGVSEIQGLYFFDGSCIYEPESCMDTDIGPFDAFGPYTWSPDGLYLAGIKHTDKQTSFIRIFAVKDDAITHFQDIETDFYVDSISWSPDGQWLAYNSGSKIYITSLDGNKNIFLHEVNYANVIGWIIIPPKEE